MMNIFKRVTIKEIVKEDATPHAVCAECGKTGHIRDMEEFNGPDYYNACQRDRGRSRALYSNSWIGNTQFHYGAITFSTPSREDLLIYVHRECSLCRTFTPYHRRTASEIALGCGEQVDTGSILMTKEAADALDKAYENLFAPKKKGKK